MGVLLFVLAMNGNSVRLNMSWPGIKPKTKRKRLFIGLWHDHGKTMDKTETIF